MWFSTLMQKLLMHQDLYYKYKLVFGEHKKEK